MTAINQIKAFLFSFIFLGACLSVSCQTAQNDTTTANLPGTTATSPATTTIQPESNKITTTLASAILASTSPPTTEPETTTTTIASSSSDQGGSDQSEPITSTTDSLDINSGDTETTIVNGDETISPGNNNDNDDNLPGIEPKSISGGATGNSLANSDEPDDKSHARLSIDHEDPSGEVGDDGQSAVRKPKLSAHQNNTSVNMTLIDEIYVQGHKEESETVEDWHKMSKKLKKGLSGVIGSMVPFALNMSAEAKISSNCSGAMLKWILSMNQLKAWALRMLDASGKPIAGLLEGSMTMFGNYRECLKVRAPDDDEIEFANGEFREYFRGKYCIIQAKPWLPEKSRFYNLNTKLSSLSNNLEDNQWYDRTIFDELSEWILAFNFVNIRYDLCVPSMCTREDIQKAINYLLKGIDLKARVLRCEMEASSGDGLGGSIFASKVESGSHEVNEALIGASALASTSSNGTSGSSDGLNLHAFSQLGWIIIPLVATVLVLIATALSIGINDQDHDNKTKLKRAISSISLKRSVNSHLNIDYDQLADDKPLALYGIRFILVLWVILVESAVNLKFEYLRELMMLKDLIFWWPMQFIINSSMQYDSFILLTAFTMGYKNVLNDGINNAKAITRFVLDKYIRLMPSIMVMVALNILLPLVYRGPVWNDYVTKQSSVCQSTGWVNTIFLQNYLPYNSICLPQTWLLCVEFQLVLLMAPLVYYLNKSYCQNYGGQTKRIIINNGIMKRPDLLTTSTSRKEDSSKAFHWFWTSPGSILAACIVAGLLGSFYNVYYNDLPPSWFYTMADPDSKALYFSQHMTKIWTHLAVFAIGLLAGVECRRATRNTIRGHRGSNISLVQNGHSSFEVQSKSQSSSVSSLPGVATKKSDTNGGGSSSVSISMNSNRSSTENINGNLSSSGGSDIGIISTHQAGNKNSKRSRSFCSTLMDLVSLLVAIAIMSTIIFSTHDWSLNDLPQPLVAGLYDAGSRLLWSLAMIWILYMVSVPYKQQQHHPGSAARSHSLLARSLGHPVMVSLGKLSFLIYIIHPFVHTTVLAIQEQPIYSSWLMMFHILIGNTTITVILASLVSVFVEMPCRNLFRRCGTSLLLTQSAAAAAPATTTTTSAAVGDGARRGA